MDVLIRPPVSSRAVSIARRYGMAVIATLLALGITQIIPPVEQRSPFLPFVGAVIFSAWYGGVKPGLLSGLLTIVAHVFFIYPHPLVALSDPNYVVPLAVFILIALLIVWLTEGRRREMLLAQDRAALLDLGPNAVITSRLGGAIRFWSHGAEKLYGWKKEEVAGKNIHTLLRTQFPVSFEEYQASLHREGHWSGDLVHTSRDGKRVVVASTQLVWRDNRGQPWAILETDTDITAREHAEQERERLLAQAEKAVRVRDQFIAMASHELKTPLTSLKGYSDLLLQMAREQGLAENYVRMLGTIQRQVRRLEDMIAALLDISRIERGQLTIDHAPVNLSALVESVVEEVKPTLRRHKLTLVKSDPLPVVDGDEVRLEQVIQNLLQNAVKYSPLGGDIVVKLGCENGIASVSTSDHGMGIPADEVPHLFTRFYRARNAETNHIGGLGVGLYLVKEIVRLHGGEVDVMSEEGAGSTFTVRLPVRV